MNKILENEKIVIKKDEVLFLTDNDINIDIDESAKVVIYHFIIDNSSNVNINLNHENIDLEYHYSTINYKDNNFVINIYHNRKNTTSNIYNHGVNVFNNKLHFDVNGYVYKDMTNTICNQENQIINIKDGKSTILPKLYIECFDSIANHSAYISKFNKDVLFYMESRGLDKEKAYQLLMKSFLIPNTIKNEYTEMFIKEINKI